MHHRLKVVPQHREHLHGLPDFRSRLAVLEFPKEPVSDVGKFCDFKLRQPALLTLGAYKSAKRLNVHVPLLLAKRVLFRSVRTEFVPLGREFSAVLFVSVRSFRFLGSVYGHCFATTPRPNNKSLTGPSSPNM